MQSSARVLAKRVNPYRTINTTTCLKPVITSISPLNHNNNIIKNNFHTSSNMSIFSPRFYTPAEPNFTGLFRLIDDFDKYALQGNDLPAQGGRQLGRLPTFTPKFDLKETENNYELHGELPGIEKNNVNIEFTDPQTIVIRGRVERSYTSGTPPAGLLEGQEEMSGAITGAPKEHPEKVPKPTVEEEGEEGAAGKAAVAETEKSKQAPQTKYWVSERSVGEFSRTFQFPSRVEHDSVNASLDNGILSVIVPKAKKHEGRRITIK